MNSLLLTSAVLIALSCVGAADGVAQTPDSKAYVAELANWRREQTADLTRDEGFLSVAGLFWLKDGDNVIGSDPLSDVKLSERTPGKLGVLKRLGGLVSLVLADGATVILKHQDKSSPLTGSPGASPILLQSDSSRIQVGEVTFMIITRGSRIGVRVFDKGCKGYRAFKGQQWFNPDLKYRFEASFVPYSPVKTVGITNVLGDTTPVAIVGYVEFQVDGKTVRLDAQGAGEGLFINFRDLTSGKSTYPAGRFLDAPKPVNGKVIIDFNRATNPPCAFTAFATCPLPPKSNYLSVSIPAGEKTHHPVE